MRVLVIGSGGREHALAWKIARSPSVEKVFVAPGNGGTEELAENIPVPSDDIRSLVGVARSRKIDLTVVGPELPLTLGIVDEFQRVGLRIFGPTRAASRLESSKAFAKNLLRECGVPTADFQTFNEAQAARDYVRGIQPPFVIKADGLAGGKGVTVCQTVQEADAQIHAIMEEKIFGASGDRVIVEEYLEGQEATFMALTDGKVALPLATSQDHKRVGEGDTGLNTGGMGAYSPSPLAEELMPSILDRVIDPVLAGLRRRGIVYKGVLYAGLMIQGEKFSVLEFNARFGDPECQAVLVRMESDLVRLMDAVVDERLETQKVRWADDSSVCVVLCEKGYPGSSQKGSAITGLESLKDWKRGIIFHAATLRRSNDWLTNGGRVLGVTALGRNLKDALKEAYWAVDQIHWDGVHYRRDIGAGGLQGSTD
jgi:phosphoribosylamine--glycine ligase